MRSNFIGVVAAEDHGKILGEFASATRQKIKQRPSILRKSNNTTNQSLLPTAGITHCSKLPQNHVRKPTCDEEQFCLGEGRELEGRWAQPVVVGQRPLGVQQ